MLQAGKLIAPTLTRCLSVFVLCIKAKLRPMNEFIAIGVTRPNAAEAPCEVSVVLPELGAVNVVAR